MRDQQSYFTYVGWLESNFVTLSELETGLSLLAAMTFANLIGCYLGCNIALDNASEKKYMPANVLDLDMWFSGFFLD